MLLEDAATGAGSGGSGGDKPESCTIAVPPWWTQQQRHAMLAAAHIAGLRNPSLVSEAAAAALQLSHRYPPGPRGQKVPAPKTVAIVSVGARTSFAALVRFSHRTQRTKVEMLQLEWEDDGAAGGRAVDTAVALRAATWGALTGGTAADHKATSSASWFGRSKRNNSTDTDMKHTNTDKVARREIGEVYTLLGSPKSAAKLNAAARKAKEVLSANREATVSVNSFAPNGADLSAKVTRREMEAAAEDAIARAASPLRRLLARRALGSKPAKAVDAIEIIGGGARVPSIQAALSAVAEEFGVAKGSSGDALGRHLNMEEAVAMGAAAVALNATYARGGKANTKGGGKRAQQIAAASAAAAASAPLLVDSYSHSIHLLVGRSTEPFELFKSGTQLPQRRVIEVPAVNDDIEVHLVEAAKPAGSGNSGSDQNGPSLAGGGSRLPASVGASRSGSDPAPFAGYQITGLKAAVRAFAKTEETARTKRAAKRDKDKKSGKGKSTEKDRAVEEGDAAPLPTSIGLLLHFAFNRQGLVVLEKAMVSPTEKTKPPTEKLALLDLAGAAQAPASNGVDKSGSKRGARIYQPQPMTAAQRRRGAGVLAALRDRDARRAAADAAVSELERDILAVRQRLESIDEIQEAEVMRDAKGSSGSGVNITQGGDGEGEDGDNDDGNEDIDGGSAEARDGVTDADDDGDHDDGGEDGEFAVYPTP
jgi:hypoxia up-regulated 1